MHLEIFCPTNDLSVACGYNYHVYLFANKVCDSISFIGRREEVLPLNPAARVGCQLVFADRRVCQSPIPVSESNNTRLKWDHLTITHPAVSRLPGHLKGETCPHM